MIVCHTTYLYEKQETIDEEYFNEIVDNIFEVIIKALIRAHLNIF